MTIQAAPLIITGHSPSRPEKAARTAEARARDIETMSTDIFTASSIEASRLSPRPNGMEA